jgi:mannose-6-phosphate isomerase
MTVGMADSALYPWRLDPKLATAIWGSGELVRDYGKVGDPHATIGESWECWDADVVTNGVLRGATVGQLRDRLGAAFVGDLDRTRVFPVLTKIITAHDWLSVQVHPDDRYARRVEGQPVGKTECWYVMAARAGAELVVGWTRDTSRAECEERIARGTLAEILRKIPVRAGDSVYVPAGMVHAIGPGVTVFETQQASDLTYRLFDWNRVGLDGKPRELHVAKAADVLDYRAHEQATLLQIDYRFETLGRTALIGDRRFTVERIIAAAEATSIATDDRPLVIMALEHAMEVACGDATTTLEAYQTAIVPAAAGRCVVRGVASPAPFLFVTPASPDRLATRLRASGVGQARIDTFAEQFSSPTV